MDTKKKFLGQSATERLVQYIKTNTGIYVHNDEPTDAPDDTLWVDLDEEFSGDGGASSSGKDGFSIFYAAIELEYNEQTDSGDDFNNINTFTIAQATIVNNGRNIQVNDLIITSNGTICSVVDISTSSNISVKTLMNINGYSPVRGTDYWTEADKAEIKSYVDSAILGGAW